MREVQVHAASGAEALADGTAALGVDPRLARVEILEADEDGVTARVYVPDDAELTVDDLAGGEADGEEGPAAARRHLGQVLRLMGLDVGIEQVSESDDEVVFNLVGEDLGVVIGSFGQTLNAVQFLVNLMSNRNGPRQRVLIDAEGYRERRRERLERLATEQAERAKQERRDVILEGLRAAERRIIHTALQNDPEVVTFSEGEEPNRRLIISPRT